MSRVWSLAERNFADQFMIRKQVFHSGHDDERVRSSSPCFVAVANVHMPMKLKSRKPAGVD